jgi:hypothetical protein
MGFSIKKPAINSWAWITPICTYKVAPVFQTSTDPVRVPDKIGMRPALETGKSNPKG